MFNVASLQLLGIVMFGSPHFTMALGQVLATVCFMASTTDEISIIDKDSAQ